MSANKLGPGQCRIGFAWDRKVSEPYPAMLRDHEGQVELVVPFDSAITALQRRYVGDMVKWGDDPDLAHHDYELPREFWFYDTNGFVCLEGVRRAGGNVLGMTTNLAQVVLRVAYAVFTGQPGVDYSKVNGIMTQVDGMDQWLGVRSVTTSLDRPTPGSSREVTVTVKEPSVVRVDHRMNLTFRSGARWEMPGGVGRTTIEDFGVIQTSVTRPRPWEEHLDHHRAIHQLVEIAAWRPLGVLKIHARHKDDPERVLSGDVIGDRWAPVTTYQLPAAEVREEHLWFLFTYPHIGPAGVRRWLHLRERFEHGINAMTFSIRHRATSLEGLTSDAGIGLEEIGHRIQMENGLPLDRAHHAKLATIGAEVADLLPFSAATWATDSTRVYNDVKHADRPTATTQDMLRSLNENRTVFRTWLARRLGVTDEVIRKGDWLLRRS